MEIDLSRLCGISLSQILLFLCSNENDHYFGILECKYLSIKVWSLLVPLGFYSKLQNRKIIPQLGDGYFKLKFQWNQRGWIYVYALWIEQKTQLFFIILFHMCYCIRIILNNTVLLKSIHPNQIGQVSKLPL